MNDFTPAEFDMVSAASDVLLDSDAITEGEWTRLRVALLVGAYGPADAELVRLALDSYADAHKF